VLDPWDFVYYPLPFILALLVWETTTRREAPVLALSATAAVWAVFVWLPQHATPDVTSAAFMALAVPACVVLGIVLYGRGHPGRQTSVERAAPILGRRSPAPSGTG
jgi:peptidoglycan/LPS O-acetylase OafA/YrhL